MTMNFGLKDYEVNFIPSYCMVMWMDLYESFTNFIKNKEVKTKRDEEFLFIYEAIIGENYDYSYIPFGSDYISSDYDNETNNDFVNFYKNKMFRFHYFSAELMYIIWKTIEFMKKEFNNPDTNIKIIKKDLKKIISRKDYESHSFTAVKEDQTENLLIFLLFEYKDVFIHNDFYGLLHFLSFAEDTNILNINVFEITPNNGKIILDSFLKLKDMDTKSLFNGSSCFIELKRMLEISIEKQIDIIMI